MADRSAAPFILRLAFRNLSRHSRRTALKLRDVLLPAVIMLGVSVVAALIRPVFTARKGPAESLRYV